MSHEPVIDVEVEKCRMCRGAGTTKMPLVSPCRCIGILKHVHHSCLVQWIKSSGAISCDFCKHLFIMLPSESVKKWEPLVLSPKKKCELRVFTLFHLAVIASMIYLLIAHKQDMPDYSYLVPVAFIFLALGSLVKMYLEVLWQFLLINSDPIASEKLKRNAHAAYSV